MASPAGRLPRAALSSPRSPRLLSLAPAPPRRRRRRHQQRRRSRHLGPPPPASKRREGRGREGGARAADGNQRDFNEGRARRVRDRRGGKNRHTRKRLEDTGGCARTYRKSEGKRTESACAPGKKKKRNETYIGAARRARLRLRRWGLRGGGGGGALPARTRREKGRGFSLSVVSF